MTAMRLKHCALFFLACFFFAGMSSVGHAQMRMAPNLAGFSGQVRGKVVLAGSSSFQISVREVLRVWKSSKAERPEQLRGRIVKVQAGGVETSGDSSLHVAFIKSLKSSQDLIIEIHNPGDNIFQILELSRDQRKQAEAYEQKQARLRGRVAEERRPTEREKLAEEVKRELDQMRNDGEEMRNRAAELQAEIVRLREEIARLKEVVAETRR